MPRRYALRVVLVELSTSHRSGFHQARYFPALDGLRALSIVPVVWHHATPFPLPGLLGRGAIGVDLFFAISGFLITTLLLRERRERGRVDLRGFYIRRAYRILPLYYLVFALNLVYALWVRPNWGPSQNFVARAPYYATFTATWLPHVSQSGPLLFAYAWSLCTEEQFYAFWAPLLSLVRKVSHAAMAMALWVATDFAFEALSGSPKSGISLQIWVIVTSFAASIGFGALLALWIDAPGLGARVRCIAENRLLPPVVFAWVASLIVFAWAPTIVLHLSLACLVLVCAACKRHLLTPILEHPAVTYVGRVSYGIYLWHVAVLGLVKNLWPDTATRPVALFALGMPLSIGVAALSYRFFESPLLNLARRSRRPNRLPVESPSP